MTRPGRTAAVLAAGLFVALLLVGARPEAPASKAPAGVETGTVVAQPPVVPASPVEPAMRAPSAVTPEPPTMSRLPSGAMVPIRAVGTTRGGRLRVPDDVRAAGWWRGGSRIGDPFGSTLVAGHVDSRRQGLGPYAELLGVRPGEAIVLSSATLEQAYEVRSLRLVPQTSLAGQRWIFAADGPHRLTLVTCSPPYVARLGGYQQLAVIVARPLGPPIRRTR